MPLLVDSLERTDMVVAAINFVLAEQGIPGLTMRRIAHEAHLSPSALTAHYGSRERMLRVIAHRTGQARRDLLRWRSARNGVLAFLPDDPDDVVTTRAWLGWCELARSQEWLTETIHEALVGEFELLSRTFEHRLGRRDLDPIQAVIDGLRVAVCAPVRPMSRERSHEILADLVAPHVVAA